MPRALTQTQKDIIGAMLGSKKMQTIIAEAANCSIRQVKRIKKNLQLFGTYEAPKLSTQGRPTIVMQNAIDVWFFVSQNLT